MIPLKAAGIAINHMEVVKVSSFYSKEELQYLGLKKYGENILISRNTCFYNPHLIEIGNNVRIDDFCILSGKIHLGNYVHIAAFCGFFAGNEGIVCQDFSGISSRSVVYASSDDYSGHSMTNPMVPDEYRNVYGGKVEFQRHVLIGSGATVLPGVTVHEGTAVGSMSLVNRSLDEWGIYVGIPCKRVKDREKRILELEEKMKNAR